jgi:hypothetical protein
VNQNLSVPSEFDPTAVAAGLEGLKSAYTEGAAAAQAYLQANPQPKSDAEFNEEVANKALAHIFRLVTEAILIAEEAGGGLKPAVDTIEMSTRSAIIRRMADLMEAKIVASMPVASVA